MISTARVFLGSFALLAARAASAQEASFVLTDDNFMDTVSGDRPVFVKFYAPWCGHCKSLAPTWEELAEAANENAEGENVCLVAKLDATVHKESAEQMKIQGFPTLIMFGNGQMYEYGGGRAKDEMEKFCFGGYKEGKGKALPWNETFVDKAKEFVQNYMQKVSQIVAFEPTILPLFFLLGVASTVFVYLLAGLCSSEPQYAAEAESPEQSEEQEPEEPETKSQKTKSQKGNKKDN